MAMTDQQEGASPLNGDMMKRLSQFITDNMEPIIDEWERFAYSIPTGAPKTPRKALRDHLPQILKFISSDIETAQSALQQMTKSQGGNIRSDSVSETAAEIHGALRLESGFDLKQMISEFRALRATVTKLWIQESKILSVDQLLDLIRFNEAIDQVLAESVHRFTHDFNASRDILLGMLGHDIRSPLGAISMSAGLLKITGPLNEKQAKLATQIEASSSRAAEIVTYLLELTRALSAAKLSVNKQRMNFGESCKKIICEMEILHPGHTIELTIQDDPKGMGDAARFEQAFSNLIANAIQYGEKNHPISVTVKGGEKIKVLVHNMGPPIPPGIMATIFNPLVRGSDEDEKPSGETTNLGLGLYVVKSIIHAHDGELSVTSTEKNGTTFVADFPRHA